MCPLASHFHQAEGRDWQDMRFCLVSFQTFFHPVVNQLLVLPVFHVDEIADDEPPDVAKTKLPGDFIRGFKVMS